MEQEVIFKSNLGFIIFKSKIFISFLISANYFNRKKKMKKIKILRETRDSYITRFNSE